MEPKYRLLIQSETNSNQIWEWQFTKFDLQFLHHQYAQGVLSRQPHKSLSLHLGEVFIYMSDMFESLPRDEMNLSVAEFLFAKSPESERPEMPGKLSGKNTSPIQVEITELEGDLLFRLKGPTKIASASVPFAVLEEAFESFSGDNACVVDGWLPVAGWPVLMGRIPTVKRLFEVPLEKTLIMKSSGTVKVLAESLDEACEIAIKRPADVEFHPYKQSFSAIRDKVIQRW